MISVTSYVLGITLKPSDSFFYPNNSPFEYYHLCST